MKKFVSVVLSVMLFIYLFSGCGNSTGTQSTTAALYDSTSEASDTKGDKPLVIGFLSKIMSLT